MADSASEDGSRPRRAGWRAWLWVGGGAPLLALLVALMAYFATRREPDFVLVLAFALCAVAAGARMAAAFRAGGRP